MPLSFPFRYAIFIQAEAPLHPSRDSLTAVKNIIDFKVLYLNKIQD
jgi:hypothetical protein